MEAEIQRIGKYYSDLSQRSIRQIPNRLNTYHDTEVIPNLEIEHNKFGAWPSSLNSLRECSSNFYFDELTLWVTDPLSHVVSPVVLDPQLIDIILQNRLNEYCNNPDSRLNLLFSRILLTIQDSFKIKMHRDFEEFSKDFLNNGYTHIPSLFSPLVVASLRNYFSRLTDLPNVRHGGQVNLRAKMLNETVAKFFHHQLSYLVGQIVGKVVKPSFSSVTKYFGGAELHPHKDREQCEYSISYCIDHFPVPHSSIRWPLHLGNQTFEHSIGDAILFKGRELLHWRSPLSEQQTSTFLFLHFVDDDFQGDLD